MKTRATYRMKVDTHTVYSSGFNPEGLFGHQHRVRDVFPFLVRVIFRGLDVASTFYYTAIQLPHHGSEIEETGDTRHVNRERQNYYLLIMVVSHVQSLLTLLQIAAITLITPPSNHPTSQATPSKTTQTRADNEKRTSHSPKSKFTRNQSSCPSTAYPSPQDP